MTKLKLLFAQKKKKFAEICQFLARDLGYGDLPTASAAVRKYVEAEAEQYVKEWEETVEMRTSPALRPMTPLRRLLGEHREICERILDEQDIEVGIWAYKKGSKRRRASASQ